MPTDLTPAEKDDRQIERLIDKEPAPSRKPSGRGAPKHDNRRRRMKDTSDKTERDKDLSNRTHASVFFIAEKVAKKRDREEELDAPELSPRDEGKQIVEKLFWEMKNQSYDLADEFRGYARKNYTPILFTNPPSKANDEKREKLVKSLRKRLDMYESLSETEIKGSPANMAAQIAKMWPNGRKEAWATRAGVIAAVQNSIKNLGVPSSVKAAMLRDPKSVEKDQELIRDLMKDADSGNFDETLLQNHVQLAALAAAYRVLQDNPESIDAAALTRDIDQITSRVEQEIQQLAALPAFMHTWEKALGAFEDEDMDEEDTKSSEFYKDVLHSLDTFFKPKQRLFEPDAFIQGLEEFYGDSPILPDELKKVVEGYRGKAASYNAIRGEAMGQRTATYHGVLQQGDPTHGSYHGYQSYDKRYFGKKNYDSIVKTAKQFLKEDWLANDWEGGAKDANFRAALDLAIHLADNSLYQGKVDVETYNMLLARLMGDKTDVFAETLITNDDSSTKSRRASAMSNQHYQALLRVASGLRETNPRAAFDIVKNLRMLVAQDQQDDQQDEEQGHTSQQQQGQQDQQGQQQQSQQQQQGQQQQGQQEMCTQQQQGQQDQQGQQQQSQQQQQGQQDQQGQQQQQSNISDKDMGAFVEGKVDIKDLKADTKKLVDAKSIEDFVDGLMDLEQLLKKTASGRTAEDETAGIEDVKLEGLEDMDEEAVKAFLEKQKAEAQKLLGENDIEKFMEGLDKIFGEAESAAKSVKTGSVVVSMTTLVRLAHANPDARPVLLAMIREAAKKKKKKDKRKKDKADKKGKGKGGKKSNPFAKGGEKGKGGKKPPFGGKKAPPFGGKKAPPFGKKSSVNIDPSDYKW